MARDKKHRPKGYIHKQPVPTNVMTANDVKEAWDFYCVTCGNVGCDKCNGGNAP